jgi:ribulose bisphosphate carboxylase small subunit
MTATNCIVVIEAPSREQLVKEFATQATHLTWEQIRKRFDDLLHHGYADARRGEDGKWRLVLLRLTK